jgi:hypothetical protein
MLHCGIFMRRLFFSLLLLLAFNIAHASPTCKASAQSNKNAYGAAVKKVEQLPEFKHWAKQQKHPVSFRAFSDGQALIEKQCYWSVSVGANMPDRLAHWQTFYVSEQSEKILVEDVAGGDPMPLAAWRNRQIGMQRIEDFPPEVILMRDRLTMCKHYAGEFNGDGSKRDKELNVSMKKLKCDKVHNDFKVIRKRYANNDVIANALDSAAEGF